MKNLKNFILLVIGCLLLSTVISLDALAQTKSKRQQKSAAKTVQCKDDDSDCFINAANTCQKATLTMSNSALLAPFLKSNTPYSLVAQTTHYEIRGKEKEKCVFYGKVVKSDIVESKNYIDYIMKTDKITRQEAEQRSSENNELFRQRAGQDGVCSFETPKLVTMLSGWWPKNGGYRESTKDFEGANCQGTLYNFTLPDKTIKLSDPPPAEPPQ